MNAAFHQLCTQPSGAERLKLLAERNALAEGLRDAKNRRFEYERLCARLERKLVALNAKLRGEL